MGFLYRFFFQYFDVNFVIYKKIVTFHFRKNKTFLHISMINWFITEMNFYFLFFFFSVTIWTYHSYSAETNHGMHLLRSYHLHVDDTYQATADSDAYYDLDAHKKDCFRAVTIDVTITIANGWLSLDAEEKVTRKSVYTWKKKINSWMI